ncbi:hypothetical protein GRS48_01305 [Halorubrum sp. JWXQ-INN 858]|uniref:hypothetical protein n=1 Tax=Halorubrum sp. JWXQ-INN 858 TaxID=2690782 RepID=UPI00135AD869|nr:hypothetical protein [Halorubrum sp. JWXQ-INN 858]MWV63468.1 hypothetical protein [Halorubrum sp. JWXQ-INN 858]
MQRRAVAVYVALFLVVGTAAGVLIATAETPEITFDDPDFELSEGDSFEVDGQEYTVADITETEAEDDVGDVEIERSGQLEWEAVVEQSETWANESVVELDDGEWRVHIEGEDPTAFTLVEVLDRDAILSEDPAADNETVERDGEEYVVVTDEDGESRLVPADDYFPAPEERSYSAGDSLEYDGHSVTVDAVTEDGVTLVWEGPETSTMDVDQEERITLGDTDFIAYFPDGETMVLSSDFEAYEAQLAEIDRLDQQAEGIWRVLIISVLSSLLVIAAAFVPSRY